VKKRGEVHGKSGRGGASRNSADQKQRPRFTLRSTPSPRPVIEVMTLEKVLFTRQRGGADVPRHAKSMTTLDSGLMKVSKKRVKPQRNSTREGKPICY